MNRSKQILSLLTAAMILLGSMSFLFATGAFALQASLSYSFVNSEAGYAQGTVTLTGDDGTYYLYWADDEKALEHYSEITDITVSGGSAEFSMPAHTAIPADATKLIAVKAQAVPESAEVKDAYCVYSLPESKMLPVNSEDVLYTFGAISDPQLANDSYGSGKYPYDEIHLAAAFETLAQRGVSFTVSSGDTVNDQNGNQTYAAEMKRYQRILADSSYCNPIYEANGNHDVATKWDKNGNYYNNNSVFIKGTGLDSLKASVESDCPYYEITEPITGDHFIFMALEGGFYTNKGTQFSEKQLDWLEGLLEKYKDDGKNIFILEHGNVAGWGAGDKLTAPYYYDLGLEKTNSDVARFISLMQTYKDCVVISGHTHLELSAQYNYSDNNGTSAVTIHNSAVGGVRRLVNGSVDRTPVKGLSEGYIVEVYENYVLFNGTNLYYNETMPQCCYILEMSTSENEPGTAATTTYEPSSAYTTGEATGTQPNTATLAASSQSATTAAVEPSENTATTSTAVGSSAADETESTAASASAGEEASEKTTAQSAPFESLPTTGEPLDKEYLYGDADLNGKVNVKDATAVQKYAAKLLELDGQAFVQADVNGDLKVNVKDATLIQKLAAKIIDKFPVEEMKLAAVGEAVSSVKQDLEDYYTYSSYNQYMALKKAYLASASQSELEVLQKELYDIAGSRPSATGEITVYFTNTNEWSKVYAYIWGSDGKPADWPGTEMTFVRNSSSNKEIYKITVDYDKYQNIIFTDGTSQTVDITLGGDDNVGYYISGGSGKACTVTAYTYS